ncbi:MAG: alanine racemase, partial [Muribaculaceae bacterium]|nr:alanine racemase [Muribaculaceae bacterium]
MQSIISPTIGIITNIGDEHRRGFSSIEAKAAEKVSLFKSCDIIVYDADDPIVAHAINNATLTGKKIGWSRTDHRAPLYIQSISINSDLTNIHYTYFGSAGTVTIPFFTPADVQNAIHLLATMLVLGISPSAIADRMLHLTPVNTRLNVIDGVNNCQIVNDTYTADFHSLAPALDFMARQSNSHRTSTVILSDLKHESQSPEGEYRAAAQLLKQRNVQRIIGIGTEISHHIAAFPAGTICYASTDEFLEKNSPSDFVDEAILIKGAPEFHFERIAQALEAKHHETVLEVNLDALVNNFNVYRSMLLPSTGIVAMVKASGYGAGVVEPAKTLQAQGAAYLAVAVVDEGVELRQAGITMPIMVMNPKVVNFRALFANSLEPVIYSFDMLNDVIREARKYGLKGYPIHIKLDTGMHRLGFLESDIPTLAVQLMSQDIVELQSIFSHLATADCPDMEEHTLRQLQTFERATSLLQQLYPKRILRHILNTAGIERFNTHQYDMARLGIGLYGITPEPWLSESSPLSALRPVSTLRTVIISIKTWPKGTAIGYSRRGILERESQIATIPIGYADGLNRHCGNGSISVLVNGVE